MKNENLPTVKNAVPSFKKESEKIQITDSAREHLKKFLNPLGPSAGFRFGVKESGCSGYKYIADVVAAPREDELCIEENEIRIFIDKSSISKVQNTVIDLVEKELGQKQLIFNNSNVEDSCGCGESFTIKSEKEND